MTCASVARGEALSGDEERCRVGSEIEEELREDVEGEEGTFREGVVCKSDDGEDDGQDEEAADLDGAAAHGVDERNGHPVTRDSTRAD